MQILFEDDTITICIKEPGISSEDVPGGACVPAALRARWGNAQAYVGVVHRLDMGVSGVMVYARTPKAAAALSAQVAAHTFEKEYRCVCAGAPEPAVGQMHDFLFKDSRRGKVFPVKSARRGAREALLDYETLTQAPLPAPGQGAAARAGVSTREHPGPALSAPAISAVPDGQAARAGKMASAPGVGPRSTVAAVAPAPGTVPAENPVKRPESALFAPAAPGAAAALCRVRLHTGRTHQIRVQFASRCHPLLGDGKYGSRVKCPIALQCARIAFDHPRTGARMEFSAPMPGGWPWELFGL